MKTLYVAWKKDPGGWFPVGRLDADVQGEFYRFRYTHGALDPEAGFAPLDGFPDLDKDYVSSQLFPFFQNRVQNSSQPSFPDFLTRHGFPAKGKGAYDPIELLAVSEGRRETDHLEVFPRIKRVEGTPLVTTVFAHGLHLLPPAGVEETLKVRVGQSLQVVGVNHPLPGHSIQLQTPARVVLGYVPRYLVPELVQVSLQGRVKAEVVRVNLPPAPPSQRLLVRLEGDWPEGYKPMSGAEFEPLVQAGDEELDAGPLAGAGHSR